MSEWQPMEIKPPFGTRALIWGSWGADCGPMCMEVAVWRDSRDGPYWCIVDEYCFEEVTHWMPLPEPPKAEGR
jgi:Protein of unknown function (DUF551)